jgi:hypothetical protein
MACVESTNLISDKVLTIYVGINKLTTLLVTIIFELPLKKLNTDDRQCHNQQ